MHGLGAALSRLWHAVLWILRSIWRVIRSFRVPILWWGRTYKKHPIAVLLFIALLVVSGARVMRAFSPHQHFVVSPFEVPSPTSGHIAVTGRTVANLLADELQIVLNESAGASPTGRLWTRTGLMSPAVPAPDSSSVGLEVGGLSLETFISLWNRIRHQHEVITGDVIFIPGSMILQARTSQQGPWEVGVQLTTADALKAACRQLALDLLLDVTPEVMGHFYQGSGKYDQAIEAYNKALELDPQDHPDILTYLGDTLASKGAFDEAIAKYEEAIDLKPDHVRAWFNLATTLSENGNETEAIEAYERIIDLKVADPETLDRVGIALQARDEPLEAIKAHRQAVRLKPKSARTRFNLVSALEKAQQNDEAQKEKLEAQRLRMTAGRRPPQTRTIFPSCDSVVPRPKANHFFIFRWTPDAEAKSYTVEIDRRGCEPTDDWYSKSGNSWKVKENLGRRTRARPLYSTMLFEGLEDHCFRWRVWAVDSNGNEGKKSPWCEFSFGDAEDSG